MGEETGQTEKVCEGEGSPVKKLRHTYATKEEASRAAKAELDKIKRAGDTISMTMPGNPLITAERQSLGSGPINPALTVRRICFLNRRKAAGIVVLFQGIATHPGNKSA